MVGHHRGRAPRPLVRRRRRRDRSAAGRRADDALGERRHARGRAWRRSSRRAASPTAGSTTATATTGASTRRRTPPSSSSRSRRGRRARGCASWRSGFAALAAATAVRAADYEGNVRGWKAELGELVDVRGEGGRLTARPAPEVLAALADPTRWQVLSLLAERGEGTATTLAGELPVSRVAVIKHLAVLDRAGLVTCAPRGPRGPLHGRARSASARPPPTWRRSRRRWDRRLAAIKALAEEAARGRDSRCGPDYVVGMRRQIRPGPQRSPPSPGARAAWSPAGSCWRAG